MFRLAHISDIHLGPLPAVSRRELFSKRITGYVNFRRNRSNLHQPEITQNLVAYLKTLSPDHTVISGDLINLGLDAEIKSAAAWLQGLGKPDNITVVLGNHDAYVRGARDKALAAWQDWVCGDDKRAVMSDKDYPIVRRRGKISIIGCNSARASAPFLATGYFRKQQAAALEEILSAEKASGQCRVVVIHHPVSLNATSRYKRLIGSDHFRKAIASQGAELVLHGHTHLATTAYINGPQKKVPVICVPAGYQWTGHPKPPAGVNMLKISTENHGWSIELERHGLSAKNPVNFQLLQTQPL